MWAPAAVAPLDVVDNEVTGLLSSHPLAKVLHLVFRYGKKDFATALSWQRPARPT